MVSDMTSAALSHASRLVPQDISKKTLSGLAFSLRSSLSPVQGT
jgi:hypothetical protein